MERLALAGALKLSAYLENRISKEEFDSHPLVLVHGVTAKDIDKAQKDNVFSGNDDSSIACRRIIELCGDNPLALCTLQLACLRYLYPETAALFDAVALGSEDGVTIEIAVLVEGLKGGIAGNIALIQDTYDKLGLVLGSLDETSDLARVILRADFRLASYLKRENIPDLEYLHYVELLYPQEEIKLGAYEKEISDFAQKLKTFYEKVEEDEKGFYDPVTVVFSGEKESGRYTGIRKLSCDLGLPIFTIEYDYLVKQKDPKKILFKALKECLLMDASLCIKDIKNESGTRDLIKEVRRFSNYFACRPLFLTVENSIKVVPYIDGRVFVFDMPKLTSGLRLNLWKYMFDKYGIKSKIDLQELSGKMNLTIGQMERISLQIADMEKTGKTCDNRQIYKLCYLVLDDGRYDSITRVDSNYSLEDLKISERNRCILKEVCNQVNFRQKVYDEWNMKKKYEYGRCVSLLLAGPPGTGKTMAVHALSSELGLELYKVDLSQITDKYVGETEKRLEEVFDKAEKSNMILFFDEADAVMGKRSETKDAHDKYANTQIAFILQRMEKYDGIVILATNYLQNIDTAFMRRIRYVVNFEVPDAPTRKEIWMNSITEEVPVGKDVDFDFLADKFELAGGNIKNIMLNATFYAASENSELSMRHIIRAVAYENNKDKRIMFASDYGDYAYMTYGY